MYGVPGPGPELDFTADQRRAIGELDKIRGGLDRTAQTALGAMRVYEAYQIARGNDALAFESDHSNHRPFSDSSLSNCPIR